MDWTKLNYRKIPLQLICIKIILIPPIEVKHATHKCFSACRTWIETRRDFILLNSRWYIKRSYVDDSIRFEKRKKHVNRIQWKCYCASHSDISSLLLCIPSLKKKKQTKMTALHEKKKHFFLLCLNLFRNKMCDRQGFTI